MPLAAPVFLMVRTERSTAEGLNPPCSRLGRGFTDHIQILRLNPTFEKAVLDAKLQIVAIPSDYFRPGKPLFIQRLRQPPHELGLKIRKKLFLDQRQKYPLPSLREL